MNKIAKLNVSEVQEGTMFIEMKVFKGVTIDKMREMVIALEALTAQIRHQLENMDDDEDVCDCDVCRAAADKHTPTKEEVDEALKRLK